MTATDELTWRDSFRALVVGVPPEKLMELADALDRSDPRLMTGMTAFPGGTGAVERCCPVAFLWRDEDGVQCCGDLFVLFSDRCQSLGERARPFLRWVDYGLHADTFPQLAGLCRELAAEAGV